MRSLRTVCCGFLWWIAAGAAFADVYKYTDPNGQDVFVNDLASVPEPYQDQVETVISESSSPREVISNRARPKTQKPVPPKDSAAAQAVEIFVTSWCPFCRKLENFLQAKQIRYQRYDIESNPAAKKKYDALRGRGVPVVKIGSQVIHGFNPEAVLAALGKQNR